MFKYLCHDMGDRDLCGYIDSLCSNLYTDDHRSVPSSSCAPEHLQSQSFTSSCHLTLSVSVHIELSEPSPPRCLEHPTM
jgi:hypothetical protein